MHIYFKSGFIIILLITGAALLFFYNPESIAYPPCLFKKLTGLQCPGCGTARACYHLLHGHVLTALDYNLLSTAVLPLLVLEGVSHLFYINRNAAAKLHIITNHIRPVHVLLVVSIFWIVRNLPVYPLSLLSSDH
jgi:hypothetical protein